MSKALPFTESVEASKAAEILEHHNIHTELLLKKFPDLKVHDTVAQVLYYSKSMNTQADVFSHIKENASTYAYIHSIECYKEVSVDCPRCDRPTRVYSMPPKIPFLLEQETYAPTEFIWYSLNYEDTIKEHDFCPAATEAVKMAFIKQLKERSNQNSGTSLPAPKLDIFYLDSKIKKLLPFT